MNRNNIIIFLLALLAICGQATAKVDKDPYANGASPVPEKLSPVITGATVLSITPDARGAALAGMGVATSPDAASLFYNPAKVIWSEQSKGVMLSYTPWMSSVTKGMGLSQLSGYWRLGVDTIRRHTIATSLRYFSLGDVYVFGRGGQVNASTQPYELAFDLSYALALSPNWGLGASLRYVRSDLSASASEYIRAANTVGFDLGTYYKTSFSTTRTRELSAGLALLNLGPKLNYGGHDKRLFQPSTLRMGVGYRMGLDASELFVLGAYLEFQKLMVPSFPMPNSSEDRAEEIKRYYDTGAFAGLFRSFTDAPGGFSEELREWEHSVGFELCYDRMAYARVGFRYQDSEKGNDTGFSAGLGVRYSYFGFDFSYFAATEARNPLNNTFRFSASAYF